MVLFTATLNEAKYSVSSKPRLQIFNFSLKVEARSTVCEHCPALFSNHSFIHYQIYKQK